MITYFPLDPYTEPELQIEEENDDSDETENQSNADTDILQDTINMSNHNLGQDWDISFDPNYTPIVSNTHYSRNEYGDYTTDFPNGDPNPPENLTIDGEQSYSHCSNQNHSQDPNNSSSTDELEFTLPEDTHLPRTSSPVPQRVSQRKLRDIGPIINQRRRVLPLTIHRREINGNLHQKFAFEGSQN